MKIDYLGNILIKLLPRINFLIFIMIIFAAKLKPIIFLLTSFFSSHIFFFFSKKKRIKKEANYFHLG